MIPKLCSSSSLLLLLLQREPNEKILHRPHDFLVILLRLVFAELRTNKCSYVRLAIKIQLSGFSFSSFGTLVIIMSSCQLNRPFILALFTSCQVVKVNLFLNFVELLSLKYSPVLFLFFSAHIFLVENSESNGAPFRLFPETKYLCGHKIFLNLLCSHY